MRKILIGVFLIGAFVLSSNAQEIKEKKGIISVDGKECLKKKNSMAQNSSTIYDLATNEEILYFQYHEYKPTRLIFSQENIVVELTQEAMPMYFIKLLFENGVITEDCQINKDKIELFISKYGKLPERIIISD